MNAPVSPLLILGGRSLVAPYLMARLAGTPRTVAVASRRRLELPVGFIPLPLDLEAPAGWHAAKGDVVISLLPLWVLASHLPLFAKAKALIAIGSTSRFGKAGSDDPQELEVVRKLTEAEAKIEAWARERNIPFTILRPTLIYDGVNDLNIARIASMIRRWGRFPLAAPAAGRRQPIHADDVAAAIMGSLDNPGAVSKIFNIAGGEILTYREMVARVFRALGRSPRFLVLPVWLLKAAFRLGRFTGLLKERHFGFAVFQRMNEDLVFDVEEGRKILGVNPRRFDLKIIR